MPALQYWLPLPVIAVGAVSANAGAVVSTFAVVLAADAPDELPTLSETRIR